MRAHAAIRLAGLLMLGHLTFTGAVKAQAPGAAPAPSAELADAYHLTNADGDRVCPLRLLPGPAARETGKDAGKDAGKAVPRPPHFAVELDRASCANAVLFSADIAAWAPGPGNAIRLFSAEGRLIAEFTEGVGGTWEALREEDGVYFLVNPRLAEPAPALQPADMAGVWQLTDPAGAPLCRLTLGEAAVGDGLRLSPDAACAGVFARPAPDRWRLDGADLLLLGAGGARLRFAAGEDGTWSKVPAEGRPLHLMRAP